jgi:hypothetical protein
MNEKRDTPPTSIAAPCDAEERTKEDRKDLSVQRTKLSEERIELSEERIDLSQERIELAKERTDLAAERCKRDEEPKDFDPE